MSENRYGILNISRPLFLLVLVFLLVKLLFLNLNDGEYTDGIIQLQLWQSPVVFFPPGYSTVVWVVNLILNDLLLAGRFVSILASVIALPVFYRLAQLVLDNDEEAFLAALFLALSPIFNRWSFRVMTDSLFCLFFIICCYEFLRLWQDEKKSFARLIGWTGLAVLVRYQALYFVPLMFFLVPCRRGGLRTAPTFNVKNLPVYLISSVPWVVLIWWVIYRGFGHTQQFVERASYGLGRTFIMYFSSFEGFVIYWPWAVTYSLFALGMIGSVMLYRGGIKEKRFLSFAFVTALVFLVVQACFLSFQYRYLLPLVPLWCILAAKGFSYVENTLRNRALKLSLGIFVFINLMVMTIGVLYLQRATFGDLVDSAVYLRQVGQGSRILSDEIYCEGVYNVKMQFWSQREIHHYMLVKPKEGDILVLHNAYSDLDAVHEHLSQNFDFVVLNRWNSRMNPGEYTTIPLLPDIMVEPNLPNMNLTSNPSCMAFRFVPQHYSSVAIRLISKK